MLQVSDIQTIPEVVHVLKVLVTGLISFCIAFFLTPLWTHILYRNKIGIRIKDRGVSGDKLTVVSSLHAGKAGTPTMGGVIVWFSVVFLALYSHFVFRQSPVFERTLSHGSILSRAQVWLPLFALTAGECSGF